MLTGLWQKLIYLVAMHKTCGLVANVPWRELGVTPKERDRTAAQQHSCSFGNVRLAVTVLCPTNPTIDGESIQLFTMESSSSFRTCGQCSKSQSLSSECASRHSRVRIITMPAMKCDSSNSSILVPWLTSCSYDSRWSCWSQTRFTFCPCEC